MLALGAGRASAGRVGKARGTQVGVGLGAGRACVLGMQGVRAAGRWGSRRWGAGAAGAGAQAAAARAWSAQVGKQ